MTMGELNVRRLGYALGAEITGVDLARPQDDETIAEIRRIWLENVVVCFPGQDLSPEQMLAFCKRFGELNDNRSNPTMHHPDYPQIGLIVNKPITIKDRAYAGGVADEWHTDLDYTVTPPSATFLNAKVIPEIGGDTLFANMYLAYETLSEGLKRTIDPLEGVYDISVSDYYRRYSPEVKERLRGLNPPVVHRVVRVHPETGRKALYAGRLRNFVGMTEEETRPLHRYLLGHASQYEFTYRHRWRANDLLIWDNRCALHRAVADYERGALRQMIRCELLAPKSGYLLSAIGPSTVE